MFTKYITDIPLYIISCHLTFHELLNFMKVDKYYNNKLKTNNVIWKKKLESDFKEIVEGNNDNFYDIYSFYFKNMILPENYKFVLRLQTNNTDYSKQLIYYKTNKTVFIGSIRDVDFVFAHNIDFYGENIDPITIKLTLSIVNKNTTKKILDEIFELDVMKLITGDKNNVLLNMENISISFRPIIIFDTEYSIDYEFNIHNYYTVKLMFPSLSTTYENICNLILKKL